MRSILIHAGHDAGSDDRIDSGLAIARATGGHVTLHINTPVTAYITMDPFGGSHVLASVMEEARDRAAQLAATLEERLKRDDVPWTIEASEGELVDSLASSARLADLVIMSLGDSAAMLAARPPVGAVAISARVPVLALPDGMRFAPGGVAMVAWNGSPEAAQALRASLPLLRLADAVHLVTVSEKDLPLSPEDAAAYLSRHDVHATVHQRDAQGTTVEEVLVEAADGFGATLTVMGAYGHSRLRETLFGGVTRFAIDGGSRPLLLAH